MINSPKVNDESPLRVTIVQPAMPKYRIPVFRALAERSGIDLTVVYGEVQGLQNVEPTGFRAICSFRRDWNGVMLQSAEWTYCSRRYSDTLVLRWTPRSLMVWFAALRAKCMRVPLIIWGHGYSKRGRTWWTWLRNWQAQLATAVLFYDDSTRDAYIAKGWDSNRLFVAPNTVDRGEIDIARAEWRNRPNELLAFREEQGLKNGPVILFVSRLSAANRVDLLIEATARLVDDFPDLRTVIIGNGEAERARLRSLAVEWAVQNNVIFEDGIYDEEKLAPWFLSATVFCYPENVGLSLIHAFAYGLPVVTSDNLSVHNPEIVALKPGINGDVYQHRNVTSLTCRLRSIINDDEKRAAMSRAACETVANDFTIQRMVDGLEKAIRFASATLP